MKLPDIITRRLRRKPAPQRRPVQTTLKATAAARRGDLDDYDSPEPTTSLSAAFIIVFLLHVVAVIGIYIFNSIKASRPAMAPITERQDGKTKQPITKPALKAADPVEKSAPIAQSSREATSAKLLPSGQRVHRVQPGEYLTKIATKYSVTLADLEAANGLPVNAKIQPDQMLHIPANRNVIQQPAPPLPRAEPSTKTVLQPIALKPAPVVKPAPAASVATKPAPAKAELRTYTVDKGDTLTYIAKRYKVSTADLIKLNGITAPTKLQPGRKLRIPAAN